MCPRGNEGEWFRVVPVEQLDRGRVAHAADAAGNLAVGQVDDMHEAVADGDDRLRAAGIDAQRVDVVDAVLQLRARAIPWE